ncbi:MAG: gliding motility-associated C-terminal domain-containing protein [Bacteroidota bacterium]
MKKIYTLIFCIGYTLIFAQVPLTGLVGAWPFSGNANDVSVTGNHGTVNGATLTTDRCGNPNSAYSFNGSSTGITMPLVGPTGTVSRSLSFWAKTTNTTINSPRSTFDYGGYNGIGGNAFQVVWNYCAQGVGLDIGNQALIRGNPCLLDNMWHHIAIVFNATVSTVYSSMNYYLDGVLQPLIVCNVTGTNSTINTLSTYPITIGKNGSSNTRYWLGELDDFYLYDRALTYAEVLQLYNICSMVIPVSGNTLVCQGSANTYSVPPITSGSYTWTLPGGWTGTSLTNTISATVAASGTISVAGSNTCGAFFTSSLAVATMTVPVLNLSSTTASLCPGNSATLTAQGANNYTWTPTVQFTSSIVISPPATVNHTVRGTSTLTGCASTAVISQFVSTYPVIFANSTGSLPCIGSTTTLSALGAFTYSWMPGSSGGSSVIVSPTITTNYSVTGANAAGCTGTTSILAIVPSAMTLNVAANTPSACPGNSIILTANNSGGTGPYTYTWTAGPITNTYAVIQPGGNYTYTVTSKNANNCSISNTVTVDFFNTVALNAPNISVCQGSVATFTASGAFTYTWMPSGFTGSTYTLIPSGPSTYTVIASSVNGCTASASPSVSIKPVPSLAFITASITCASLGSATVSASSGVGPYSYSWTPSTQTTSIATNLNPGIYTLTVFDNGTGCISVSSTTFTSLIPFTGTLSASSTVLCYANNTGTASIAVSGGSGLQSYVWTNMTGSQTQAMATLLGAGVYTVNVTDAVTFCTVTQTFQITQPPPVTVNITPSATMACVNSSIVIAATNQGGTAPHSYTWTGSSPANFISTTQGIGGTYFYVVNSHDANSCPASGTISLLFNNYPVLTVNSATMCYGSVAGLSVSGAQSYSWYPGGFTSSSLNVFPPATSNYTVLGSTLGCVSSQVTSVTVYLLPVPGIVSGNNVCENLPIVLNASGGNTYHWVGPNGFNSVSQNTLIPLASLNNSGIYSVTVTDVNGCSASTSTFISVLSNPVPSAIGASVCLGESAGMSVSGGVSYQWTGPGGTSHSGSSLYFPVVANTNAGIYTVAVTGNNSCVVKLFVELLAYPYALPSPTIIATNKICLNTPVSIQGSGGTSYLWTGPGNLSSTSPTLNFTPENFSLSGIYTLTVKNGSNCAASTTILITVYPLPKATLFSSKNNMCVPFCSELSIKTATGSGAPVKGFYFANSTSISPDSTITNCFDTGENRLLKVNYVDTNNCVNSSTLLINAYPKPIADFEFSPAEPRVNLDNVVFTDISVTTPQSEWSWYFENDSIPVREKDPAHTFSAPSIFPVVLIVKNNWGCHDTVIKAISVDDEINLFVPNAFTPNADGLNDVFQPKGTNVVLYNLEVFDRWGQKLFNTHDFYKAWDGTFKGELCKMDTYIWIIRIIGKTGKPRKYQGHVTMQW